MLIERLRITIIGSGNVATVFGRLLYQNGFIINEIVSHKLEHAKKLANELNATASNNIQSLLKSDVYIIAVNDNAVEQICSELVIENKIVIHTCGSVSKNVLKKISPNFGILYPLQSLRKEIHYNKNIPLLIDASNDEARFVILQLASAISGNIKDANDNERLSYHIVAIVVSNFSNHLFALAKNYCSSNNINFNFLMPLIEETVNRMYKYDPVKSQTGPAFRGDVSTVEKHLELLKSFPQLQNVYAVMSESIVDYKKSNEQNEDNFN